MSLTLSSNLPGGICTRLSGGGVMSSVSSGYFAGYNVTLVGIFSTYTLSPHAYTFPHKHTHAQTHTHTHRYTHHTHTHTHTQTHTYTHKKHAQTHKQSHTHTYNVEMHTVPSAPYMLTHTHTH